MVNKRVSAFPTWYWFKFKLIPSWKDYSFNSLYSRGFMNILSDLRRIKKKVSISGMSRAVDKTHLVAPCSRFFALSVHCWILIMVRAPVLTLMELQTWLISMFPFLASEEGFSMWNVVSLDASFVFGCFVLWCSGLVLALHLLYRSRASQPSWYPAKAGPWDAPVLRDLWWCWICSRFQHVRH